MIAEYVAALRKLSTFCKFGAFLDDALRDRLVCGIRHEATQKHLLSIKDLTFKVALEKAQGMEAADRNIKELHSPGSLMVHHVRKPASVSSHQHPSNRSYGTSSTSRSHNLPRKGGNTKYCHRCGKDNHRSHQCCFHTATCRACGKQGHIAKVCHSKPIKGTCQDSRNYSRERSPPLTRSGIVSVSTWLSHQYLITPITVTL